MAPRTTKKKDTPPTPPAEPEVAAPAPDEDGKTEAPPANNVPDGVLITKDIGGDGNLKVNVVPVGNVQITEVQTIIEIGLRFFREQIGLSQAPR